MKYVISRYNHHLAWLADYSSDFVLYDRSEIPLAGAISVPNVGSDIFDKLSFIIDHYEHLPEVATYIKANLFDYIKPREFEKIKDNQTFTPILSQDHHTYMPVCWYKNGMYCERNDYWYLHEHPTKYADEIIKFFDMDKRAYNEFAPGSNYILPKANILQHPKEVYEQLRSYLDWTVYPGEAQLLERNLYYLWK